MGEGDTKEIFERITRLETQNKSMFHLLTEMNGKLDTWQANYVPRPEITEMNRSRDQRHDELRQEHEDLRKDFESYKADRENNRNEDRRSRTAVWPSWVLAIASVVSTTGSAVTLILAFSKLH